MSAGEPIDHTDSSARSERILYVPLEQLQVQSGPTVSPQSVKELTRSLQKFGMLQPVLVRREGSEFEVLVGFKRVAAARHAGLTEIPVRVFRVDDATVPEIQAAANLQSATRVPVTPQNTGGTRNSEASLSSLFEEELSMSTARPPYWKVIAILGAIVLIAWPILLLVHHFRGKEGDSTDKKSKAVPEKVVATPQPGRSQQQPRPTPQPSGWAQTLAGIDGIKIKTVGDTARIMFDENVFSSITTIDRAQKERLLSIVTAIRAKCASCMIAIIGHTDNEPVRQGGRFSSNRDLAEKRAESVRDYLAQVSGIPPSHLRPLGSDIADAPYPNDTPESRKRNRTVTLEIIEAVR